MSFDLREPGEYIPTDADYVRFVKRTIQEGDCWLWVGTVGRIHMGVFNMGGFNFTSGQASWLIHEGPIPRDMMLKRACGRKECVNPEHLYLHDRDNTLEIPAYRKRQEMINRLRRVKV